MKTNNTLTSFDDYLDASYGQIGTPQRTEFEISAKAFAIGEIIKEERRLAHITQQQLGTATSNCLLCIA